MTDANLLMKARAALKAVEAPGGDIVSCGAIEGLSATTGGVVRFTLNADKAGANAQALLERARAAVEAVEGVSRVAAVATAHRAQTAPAGGHANPFALDKKPRIEKAAQELAGVKNVIAVASGKGGVGKSTIAANLAVALGALGYRVGLLDADIYGPSLPTLFALSGKPDIVEGKIRPVEKFGVKSMSIGLLVDAERALAWRGPMVMGAIRQLIGDVEWGALDYLIVDTPPGTGDAHLTLAQSKRLTGAIIVSTPQEMALADVRRGVELFRKTNVPILGVVENMAWLETAPGEKTHLFGKGGAQAAARDLGAPFLGALPIEPDLRIACDEGVPIAFRAPGSTIAAALSALAEKIAARVS
ncbi:MAG: Mrp/NBP35 family ATP-binding protein [Parvularculaceae bacterium]|nr:Mrp/NBP35 family ATP-binding protein [Parvularculaceae bacterium]